MPVMLAGLPLRLLRRASLLPLFPRIMRSRIFLFFLFSLVISYRVWVEYFEIQKFIPQARDLDRPMRWGGVVLPPFLEIVKPRFLEILPLTLAYSLLYFMPCALFYGIHFDAGCDIR